MVNIMAAALSGRAAFFPDDPPRGKGNRVAAAAGLAGSAIAPLPTLALQYRARVPANILERSGAATPLAGGAAAAAADPKGLLRGQLRTASMPVTRSRTMMAGLRWGAGSPRSDDDAADHPHYQQQQQHTEHDVEHGLGFGVGLLRLPSSRAPSGRSLSFLLQQRQTPSIPEEPALQGWDAAAAGKDAAAVRRSSDTCTWGADVRSSSSSSSSGGGWGAGLGGLFAVGGSRNSSKARLSRTLRSQSAIVSRSSSGYDSAGAASPIGGSSGSASHAGTQAVKRPAAADVVDPVAILGQQHQAAFSAAGIDSAAAAAAGPAAAVVVEGRMSCSKGAVGDEQRSDVAGQQEVAGR
jgi:hypothetical protein